MTRALLVTGGPGHPADATVPSLRRLFEPDGGSMEVWDDVAEGLAALDTGRHDLLVVNALACTLPAPRHDDIRAESAFELEVGGRATLDRWHGSGHPILVLHAGVISFDNWCDWAAITGARWDWNRSWHPPLGPAEVSVGAVDAVIDDEIYCDLDLADDLDVVAEAVVHDVRRPIAWTRGPRAGGQVAVDLLGHDRRSLDHPAHVALLERLLAHLAPAVDATSGKDTP